MKKTLMTSVILAALLTISVDVVSREISEKEMQALLDGSSEQVESTDAELDTTQAEEQASDEEALNNGEVTDVEAKKKAKKGAGELAEEEVPAEGTEAAEQFDFDESGMQALLDNPEFKQAMDEVERLQKEDPEKFEQMMQESMQAMQEMMQDPEAMKAMMQGMPEELLAEAAADGKANELLNGAPATAPAA